LVLSHWLGKTDNEKFRINTLLFTREGLIRNFISFLVALVVAEAFLLNLIQHFYFIRKPWEQNKSRSSEYHFVIYKERLNSEVLFVFGSAFVVSK